jgi:hypothetical protein
LSLLNNKYRELEPTSDYLTDPIVLAQAWKKANQHIRMTNWYADTFELDRTIINLESKLAKWKLEFETADFSFEPLMLVPAPKTSQWEFHKVGVFGAIELIGNDPADVERLEGISHRWQPVVDADGKAKGLRPLAHISIADQTIFTSLMMCLANQVETLQGDGTTDFDDVHDNNVVNYGNRLYCQYADDKAQFSWGNSTTYSKFFADYRKFLTRTLHFGALASRYKTSSEKVYEVHLDLAKFFDLINRDTLVEKIKVIADNDDPLLNKLLVAFKNWQWDEGSPAAYKEVCASEEVPDIPKGIPQGLVSGGFFANIYLLDFDDWFAQQIGQKFNNSSLVLADYCRYVDDMRLIVVAKEGESQSVVKQFIKKYVGDELEKIGLRLNKKKTLVELFKPKNGGISSKLNDIQHKVSGPISINEIDEHLGHLEGLVTLATQLSESNDTSENTNPLATIEKPVQDVRGDTLLRFCANKIHTLLKQKRSMVAQEVNELGEPIPGGWDYLQEHMARKFISAWSRDPSLTLLLKKGIEFYPNKIFIQPVIEQLKLVLQRGGKEEYIARYNMCEIFRHTATVVHAKDKWAFPAHAKVDVFFEYLQNVAIEFIENEMQTVTSLGNQARFFCLVRNDSPLDKDTSDRNFNVITKMMRGYRNISTKMDRIDLISNSILAFQMAMDKSSVVRAVSCLLEKYPVAKFTIPLPLKSVLQLFIEKVASESPEFFEKLITYATAQSLTWAKTHRSLIKSTGFYQQPITGELAKLPNDVSLLGIVKRTDNPFAHENGMLKLLDTLLDQAKGDDEFFEKIIDLNNSKIGCDDWPKLQTLNVELKFKPAKIDGGGLYPIPEWVSTSASTEHKKLYHIGIFIRSCLIGKLDWSASHYVRGDNAQYYGIKTSFAKRQLGMMHSPEALNGDTAPMSNWLSCLLFRLLQWPGIQLNDTYKQWPTIWNLTSLHKLIKNRIEEQKALYCHLSGIPGYVERIDLGWNKDKKNLKVVMVQSLLPLKGDFQAHGLLLDTAQYRVRHRRHVASVAELILHKINSQNSIDDDKYKKSDIDLIIWPELAVNIEDIDILEQLVDKTGAMIFTGLTFIQLKCTKGPNNVGMWLIPNKQKNGRQFIKRLQGKQHMMADERDHVEPWRPYQMFIELVHPAFESDAGFKLTGSICYDATDIKLSADLKGKSNAYVISALNQDVATFDSMVDSLFYHMYQHVVLVNSGEFGGSVAKAPYKEHFDKLITHVHGSHQVTISSFDMNMFDFRGVGDSFNSGKKTKTKPAG